MKMKLLLAAALLMGSATLASAQINPTTPQRGGVVNQTTVPPVNPANPATNPGTIDQRTPTTTSPTQQGVIGTIDQTPLPQRTTTMQQDASQPLRPTRITPRAGRRPVRQTPVPRSAVEGRTITPETATPRP